MGHVVRLQDKGKPGQPGSLENDFACLPADLPQDPQAMNAFNAFAKIYGGSRREMEEALARGYHKDAIFHDHLVWVQGRDRILANNFWWTRVFSHGTIGPVAVVRLSEPNPDYAADNYVLAVSHTGNCDWSLLHVLGWTYLYYATAHLTVRKSDGKILEHVDIWHNMSFMLPTTLRWLLGWFIVLVMQCVMSVLQDPAQVKSV